MIEKTEKEIMQNWKGDISIPIVSVSIVTYNHEKYITESLNSVLNQKTDFSFEIVIGEDCSTDNTKNIINNFKKKFPRIIRIIEHKQNIGAQENYACVSYECRGKYIAHLDGDDLMLPNKLQIQFDFLETHLDFIAVGHPVRVFQSETNKTITFYDKRFISCKKSIFTKNDILNGVPFAHSAKMYRKEAIDKIPIDLKTKNVGDYLLHIQHASLGKFACINQILGEYRIHNKSQNAINLKNRKNALYDITYSLRYAKKLGYDLDSIIRKKNHVYFSYSLFFLKKGDLRTFKKLITLSSRSNYFYSLSHIIIFILRNNPHLLLKLYRIFS